MLTHTAPAHKEPASGFAKRDEPVQSPKIISKAEAETTGSAPAPTRWTPPPPPATAAVVEPAASSAGVGAAAPAAIVQAVPAPLVLPRKGVTPPAKTAEEAAALAYIPPQVTQQVSQATKSAPPD